VTPSLRTAEVIKEAIQTIRETDRGLHFAYVSFMILGFINSERPKPFHVFKKSFGGSRKCTKIFFAQLCNFGLEHLLARIVQKMYF
jgi:hypothetical protein